MLCELVASVSGTSQGIAGLEFSNEDYTGLDAFDIEFKNVKFKYHEDEEETLKEVVEARNLYENSNTHEEAINADLKLNEYVPKLIALAESYPELKANENYKHLQQKPALI